MAVILTNMDMPSCCAYCEFADRWDNASCVCKRKPMEESVPDGYKPEWCPLAEVQSDLLVRINTHRNTFRIYVDCGVNGW